jgi:hypothetical protein
VAYFQRQDGPLTSFQGKARSSGKLNEGERRGGMQRERLS